MNTQRTQGPEVSADTPTDDINAIVRANLSAAIALRHTTPTRVARAAELSPNVVTRFLKGTGSIQYDTLFKICEVLDVPMSVMSLKGSVTPERLKLQAVLETIDPAEFLKWISRHRSEQ